MMAIAIILTALCIGFGTVVMIAVLKAASDSDDEETLNRIAKRIEEQAERGLKDREISTKNRDGEGKKG